ncbi:hypothetical protein C9374_013844 [Naegleria lovaniensis]|uniref:Ras family small GTPase n=1 Tax=Naegleria lovaniensis TaxID=51637 RepID=A0AA88H0Z7_NAELO|nr:uncharacterized protein C9374_013844 [Naegleria lovaniensis]KAG2389284.1 hypothetical protein C9374_013844 [Naegleria lovaniensis]
MPNLIQRFSLRHSLQQRQSIQQDRRRTIRGIPFFHDFKIAILGAESVGKSCIAQRCVGKEQVPLDHEPTIEDEYVTKVQFTFRMPAPPSQESTSNLTSLSNNGVPIKENPKGDIYGYKQMAHDLEIIPQELRDFMKLDDTLLSIKQQKDELQAEQEEKQKQSKSRKFSFFKKRKDSTTASPSGNSSIHHSHLTAAHSPTSASPNQDLMEQLHHGSNHHLEISHSPGKHVGTELNNHSENVDIAAVHPFHSLISDISYTFEQDVICRVTIVDTSGQSVTRKQVSDLSGMDGFMLVFDMNDKSSFAQLQILIEECKTAYFKNGSELDSNGASSRRDSVTSGISTDTTGASSTSSSYVLPPDPTLFPPAFPPMVIVMNKIDEPLSHAKTVNAEYGYTLGESSHCPFYVVSAIENWNIQESFEALLSEIIKRNIEEGKYESNTSHKNVISTSTTSTAQIFVNPNISISSVSTNTTTSNSSIGNQARNFQLPSLSVGAGNDAQQNLSEEEFGVMLSSSIMMNNAPQKQLVRQSVSATLRKYVKKQFKKSNK